MDKSKFKLGDVVQVKSHPQAIGYVKKLGWSEYFDGNWYIIEWFQRPQINTYLDWDSHFFEKYLRRYK